MKSIDYKLTYIEHFRERITPHPALIEVFEARLALFQTNQAHPLLADHALNWGMQGFRAFSVTKDIRVVYRDLGNTFEFADIGTHKQVYRKLDQQG